jgi:hypothetical protein
MSDVERCHVEGPEQRHTSRRTLEAEELAANAMPEKPAALNQPFEAWGEMQTR